MKRKKGKKKGNETKRKERKKKRKEKEIDPGSSRKKRTFKKYLKLLYSLRNLKNNWYKVGRDPSDV